MGLAATLEPSVKVSFDPGTERSSGDAVSLYEPKAVELFVGLSPRERLLNLRYQLYYFFF